MIYPLMSYHASKATNLPPIAEDKAVCVTDLRELRNTQSKTFRRLLQSALNQGYRDGQREHVTIQSLKFLKGINGL